LLLLGVSALPAQGQGRDFGADVSHYQGSSGMSQSAFTQMFAEGRRFIFIKATEGLTGPDDSAMANNVVDATTAGLLVGVYHYAHPENRPTPRGAVQEADHLLTYAGNAIAPGRLRPVLDLESKAAKLATSALTDWVIAFCDEVVAQRGPTAAPIIYCSQYFANSKLDSRLANYNLWLADPSSSADPDTDDPPGSTYSKPTGVFNNWCFWQHSTSGSAGGVSPLSLDVCHNEFKSLLSFVIRPVLPVSFTRTNILSFSWPSSPVSFAVQAGTDPHAGNWATLTNAPLSTD
jgi:lysozyme